jgi:RNA polymerase sigma-70 factor (ECF subfamily)
LNHLFIEFVLALRFCEDTRVTLRERSFLGGRFFDAFRSAPAEAPVVEVAPVEQPTSTENLSQEEIRAEALLVEEARRDPTAFGVLYERYVDRIYGYIYHRVGNVQEAEDLTARTFYRALDNLESYEDRGAPFAAWLFRIAHNLMANWHRDRSRRRFLSLDRLWAQKAEEDSPEEQIEQEENHEALWSAISRLPEERRNLLVWKFGSQMSNLEIGEMMNKSESAIKSLYFRTLAALRQDLEARGWGGGSTVESEPEKTLVSQKEGTE